jgi:hypothetical protein
MTKDGRCHAPGVEFAKVASASRSPTAEPKPSTVTTKRMLNKFRLAAEKAGIQATAFLKESSNKVANESRDFVQGFSLPGEAEKAAKILESFLGEFPLFVRFARGSIELLIHLDCS